MSQESYYFQMKKLTVGYQGKKVVSDVDLCVEKGQILSLVGPNGAGKTTMLRSLIGQLRPIAGVAMLDRKNMFEMDLSELSKKMAVVLTERLQTEMMTVEDVVDTGRYPYTGRFGILSHKDHEIVVEAMQMTDIMDIKDQSFTRISDGQKQRVMLARALAQQPEIIVLDEPTSFLDMKYKLELLSLLYKLSREKNLTVIMSLHEVDLAQRISDRIACFKNGMLDRYGSPDEVFTEGYLLELFDIKEEHYEYFIKHK